MNPPDKVIILCVDEKTQIQALERRQQTLFPQRNLPPYQSHDYFRHGTIPFFTTLDYLTDNVIGECTERHTSEDYLKFIKKLDKACEQEKVFHIIVDNYKTHTSKIVQKYMAKHPVVLSFILHHPIHRG